MHRRTLSRRSIWFCHVGPEPYLATIYPRSLAQSSRSGVSVCACGLCGRVAVDTTGPDIPVYRAIPNADGIQFPISSRYVRILPPLLPRDYVGTGALSRRMLACCVALFAFRSFERRGRAASYSDRCRAPHNRPGATISSCIGSRHDEADQDPPLASHQVTYTTAPRAQ